MAKLKAVKNRIWRGFGAGLRRRLFFVKKYIDVENAVQSAMDAGFGKLLNDLKDSLCS